jgi:hypothetical protein
MDFMSMIGTHACFSASGDAKVSHRVYDPIDYMEYSS